jgi:hypothetical protein
MVAMTFGKPFTKMKYWEFFSVTAYAERQFIDWAFILSSRTSRVSAQRYRAGGGGAFISS